MKKYSIIFLLLSLILITSCGKTNYVEPGNISTDLNILTNGRFIESSVKGNTNYEGFVCSDAFYYSKNFYYILKNDILYSLQLISFNNKGSEFSEITLELPFSLGDQIIFNRSGNSDFDYNDLEGVNLYYFDPFFNYDHIEGYCSINGIKYSDTAPTTYISNDFYILWNLDGSIKSVELVELDNDIRNNTVYHKFTSFDEDNNLLTVTNSAVVRSLPDGKYKDTYFDFINSSFGKSLDKIIYADENLFSASIIENGNKITFSIFERDDRGSSGVTPISLYCSSIDKELLDVINSYNNTSKNYRIGVKNYSDIYRDYNDENIDSSYLNKVAIELMNESIGSGDIPDLIYEASGCDNIFLYQLINDNRIIDLRDYLKKDKDINKYKYLNNIYDITDENGIYCIIPSFTYDTYVASSYNENISRNWTLDEYEYYRSLIDPSVITLDSYTSEEFLLKALEFNGYSWINISSGDATFGDDYKKYLELAYNLPHSYEDYKVLSSLGEISINISTFFTPIGNLSGDYLLSWRRVSSEPNSVGFPTNTDSDRVIHPTGAFMICSDRLAAPGCWEFVKTILSTEYQDSLTDAIPVLQSSFEKWKNRTSYDGFAEWEIMMLIDGQMYTAPQITSDKVDLLSSMILSCDKYYFTNYNIEEIVLRNANEYFDGNISVDEAAYNTEIEVEAYLKSILPNAS